MASHNQPNNNTYLAKAISRFIATLPKLNKENDAEENCIEQIEKILELINDVRIRDMLCQICIRLIMDCQGIFRESPITKLSEHQCFKCEKHFEGNYRSNDNFIHSQFVIVCHEEHREKIICGDCLTGFTIIGSHNNHPPISIPCNTKERFEHRIKSLVRYLNCLVTNLLNM